jgi:hypothetical protein
MDTARPSVKSSDMGDGLLSAHFSAREMACKCSLAPCPSALTPVDPRLLDVLERMRAAVGPLRVTSGLRCERHNLVVGGAPDSEHLYGAAADLYADTAQRRMALVRAALDAGVTRIGVDRRFVHVGVSTAHPADVLWLYGPSRFAA